MARKDQRDDPAQAAGAGQARLDKGEIGMNITKEAFVGAMAATSVMSNIAKLVSYTQSGLLRADMTWPALALAASAVVAALLGKAILKKIKVETFELGVKILLGLAAAARLI